jgi:2-polyprenyl-6-methoxyphenol hydroxylase-like FAD-dependent oxidoreductase
LITTQKTYPIIIAGGGPVGLFLAIKLIQSGIECLVLEKKSEIDKHSKSLGIHPVSLELFDDIGIANLFIEKGIKIFNGHAFFDQKKVGSISFEECPPPFNFILALPQYNTEQILQEELNRIAPDCLQRNTELIDFRQKENQIILNCKTGNSTLQLHTRWLIGCDGKHSVVRQKAGITFQGQQYPDTYIMGDVEDNTTFGPDAAVYIHREGLVESFPLPGSMRRWVLKTDHYIEKPSHQLLARILQDRIDTDISGKKSKMISSFGVQHFHSNSYYSGRVLLAGDSAHIVSPIGGQGMNLGWITAHSLCNTIASCFNHPDNAEKFLQSFSNQTRKIVQQVASRAEINMRLGRRPSMPFIRRMMIRIMVNTPLKGIVSRIFTMRGLGKWWI